MKIFSAEGIPYSTDVWNEIQKFIDKKIENVVHVTFKSNSKNQLPELAVRYLEDNDERVYKLNFTKNEIVKHLCDKFNLPTKTITELSFELKPNEIPVFDVKLYPYVNDPSELSFSYPRKIFLDCRTERRCK